MSILSQLFQGFSVTSSASTTDAMFRYVSLLLNGDLVAPVTTNISNNNTFIDTSNNGYTITRVGTPTSGTFSPYSNSGWSGYFNASSSYLSMAGAGQFGATDFTVECWVNLSAHTQTQPCIFSNYNSYAAGSLSLFAGHNASSTTNYQVAINGGAFPAIQSTATINYNVWTHLAIVRSGSTITLYVNGTANGTATSSATLNGTGALTIGASLDNVAATGLNGNVSNFRIVKGSAVYTGNFTPPTAPLTAITNTSVLTLQDNRFKDNSTNNFALAVTGAPAIQPNTPFSASTYSTNTNGGAMYFNGTTDHLSVPSTGLGFGTGDFTIECWVYLNTVAPTYQTILDYRATGLTSFPLLGLTGAVINFSVSTGNIFAGATLAVNTWYHVAVTRAGTSAKLFINGVQSGSTVTNTTNITANSVATIGNAYDNYRLNGYLSDLRIVKGTAVYTGNFTPPTAPLTAIAKTELLLNGTSAGIIDNAGKINLRTASTAQTQTTLIKYGTGSMSFNGTSDYLTTATSSTALVLANGDFTIEAWINFQSGKNIQNLISFGPDRVLGISINRTGIGDTHIYLGDGTSWFATPSINSNLALNNLTAGVWNHVALVRSGTTVTLYHNGINAGSVTSSPSGFTGTAIIGAGYPGAIEFFKGNISDLRVTKGVARYTGNFTPPVAALPDNSTNDVNFNNVSLLLHGNMRSIVRNNTSNNIIIDNSPNGYQLTKTGTPATGSYSPYSPDGWSTYFNGSTDRLISASNAIFALGNNTWTIEGWIYPTVYTSVGVAIWLNGAGNSDYSVYINAAGKVVTSTTDTGLSTSSTSIPLNTWTHVAVVAYSAGLTKIYINGTQDSVTGTTFAITSNAASVGGTGIYYYPGYISNVRITKSVVYSGNFTPSVTPLTALPNTIYLTCQDSRFKDNSANNFSLTTAGTPAIQPMSPFAPTASYNAVTNGGSVFFNGTTDFVSAPTNAAFNFGTGDFTIEFWMYPTSMTGAIPVFSFSGNEMLFQTQNSTPVWYVNGIAGGWAINSGTIAANVWTHIALVRLGSTCTGYINGVANPNTSSHSESLGSSTATLSIGKNNTPAYFPGYISDFRVVKGTAVYTGNFTPTTTPLTANANTQLLVNGANSGIIDLTTKSTLRSYGTSQVSTSQIKYGTGSLMFNGTTDYLAIPNNIQHKISNGNFTIEGWFYISSVPDNWAKMMVISTPGAATNAEYCLDFGVADSRAAYCTVAVGSTLYTASSIAGVFTFNQWVHIAGVRNGGTLTVYVNGVSVGTNSAISTSTANWASTFNTYIGTLGTQGRRFYAGYMDDLRLTNGVARYTGNFTVPDKAFPTR